MPCPLHHVTASLHQSRIGAIRHARRRRARLRIACFAWFLLFVAVNVALGPLLDYFRPGDTGAFLVFLCFGVIGAQGGLHALWCVFAPAGPRLRTTIAVASASLLFFAWAMGYMLYVALRPVYQDSYLATVMGVLFCLPLVAVATQWPLWVLRTWLGWRIVHRSREDRPRRNDSFSIRDLMAVTGIVALALVLPRAVILDSQTLASAYSTSLGFGCVVGASTMLLLAAGLRARRVWFTLPVALLLVAVIAASVVYIIAMAVGSFPRPEEYALMVSIVVSFFGCLTGALLTVRLFGYRMVARRER